MGDRRSIVSPRNRFNGRHVPLTPDQENALLHFKENLAHDGLYAFAREGLDASHDDAILIRFLRAGQFSLTSSQKIFTERIAWEKEHDVRRLYANFPLDEFCSSQRLYARWTGRRDRSGLPVYVHRLGALIHELQDKIVSIPPKRRYERLIAFFEFVLRLVAPLCSHLPHSSAPTPVTAITLIVDLADVSFRTIWGLRTYLQEAITLANNYYPETLGTIFVVNAPSFFSTIWGWLESSFQKSTREKIYILGPLWSTGTGPGDPSSHGGTQKDVTGFDHPTAAQEMLRALIEPENLPRIYGGTLQWDFLDEPLLDAAALAVIGEMPRGPWVFVDGEVRRPLEYDGPGERVWSGRQSLSSQVLGTDSP